MCHAVAGLDYTGSVMADLGIRSPCRNEAWGCVLRPVPLIRLGAAGEGGRAQQLGTTGQNERIE